MQDVLIRTCEEKDIVEILQLQKQWYCEDSTYGFVPGEEQYLISKLGAYFFVAEKDTALIGFVYGAVHQAHDMAIFAQQQTYLEIDDIYVSPAYRDASIGGALLDTILKTARANGIDRSFVNSASKDMDRVLKFYRQHGYKTWSIQMFQ
jgi:ribosomal protein S18 acetylase RimI-like enzyme